MMSIKKLLFFIFTLTIFFLVIPNAQAGVDYTILKDEYIKNHPGQAIIPYPWNPITSTKVLPFNYEIPADPENSFSITACPDQFEAASFIITAQNDTSGIEIQVSDFYNSQGNRIPSDAIDVRLVKVWYQAGEGTIINTGVHILTPELLLKDDTLVKVDYVNHTNYLKVTINGSQQYIDISNPTTTFPVNAKVYDAESLQPFSLKANENKQIWITTHIPRNQTSGNYTGTITISAPTTTTVKMIFNVRVLPFSLQPSMLKYGIYYTSELPWWYDPSTYALESDHKTRAQMAIELQDIKDHGIRYPTLYQDSRNITQMDAALSIRDSIGFSKDMIVLGHNIPSIGNGTTPAELAVIAEKVNTYRNFTNRWGYTDTYFYGMDEAKTPDLETQRAAFQTVHNNSGKIFTSSYYPIGDLSSNMGDIVDAANIGYSVASVGEGLNSTEAAVWHSYGHKVFSYGNPQVGVENPEVYRRNYGLDLWVHRYDGAFDFAYQQMFGQSIWNDFDNDLRDHVFAYPTSNGVIDTIQWEGWREGVDDTRYLATLMKNDRDDTPARTIISDSLSKGEDMATIRQMIIEQILRSSLTANEQLTIGIYPNGVFYLKNGNTGSPADLTFGYGQPKR